MGFKATSLSEQKAKSDMRQGVRLFPRPVQRDGDKTSIVNPR